MTVTEAKELFEWLEDIGYGDFNIAVNNIRPNNHIITIGRYKLESIIEKDYAKRELQKH